MDTFSQVLVATLLTVIVGFVMGVWAAESRRVSRTLRPINDVLQTLPQLVYIIPFIYLMQQYVRCRRARRRRPVLLQRVAREVGQEVHPMGRDRLLGKHVLHLLRAHRADSRRRPPRRRWRGTRRPGRGCGRSTSRLRTASRRPGRNLRLGGGDPAVHLDRHIRSEQLPQARHPRRGGLYVRLPAPAGVPVMHTWSSDSTSPVTTSVGVAGLSASPACRPASRTALSA